jgi:hypothetical protein
MGRSRRRHFMLVALSAASALAAAAALLAACGASASPQAHARIAPSCRGSHWVASWIASPSDADGRLDTSLAPFDGGPRRTYPMIITPHLAGSTLRVRLTNRFGARPVRFGRVTIARQASGASVVAATIRSVRFHGHAGVTVPPGHSVTSDPVRLGFRAFQNLAVSWRLPPGG